MFWIQGRYIMVGDMKGEDIAAWDMEGQQVEAFKEETKSVIEGPDMGRGKTRGAILPM